jgi:hypothetical protein
MSRLFNISIVFFGIAFLASGCGPEEEAPTSVLLGEMTGSYGEVFINYVQPISDTDESSAIQMSARFVRVRDIRRQEVRLLSEEELPLTTVPIGECQQVDPTLQRNDNVLTGSLEFLDVGELFIRAEDQDFLVPNWSFNDVYGAVSGVYYGGEALEAEFQADEEYTLRSSGSGEIGPFETKLRAPEEFDGLFVAGSEIGVEPVVLNGVRQPLEIRWEPGSAANEILVELIFGLFNAEQRIVCRSQEDGVAEIPSSLAAQLWEPGVSSPRLTIYRFTRIAFEAEGLDEAEALFVVSAVIPLDVP